MTRLQITSPLPVLPASLPMTLAEAKAHAKIEISDEDVFVQCLIESATELIEYGTQKKFVERQFRLFFDECELTKDLLKLDEFDSGLAIDAFTLFDDTEPTAIETAVPAADFLLLDHRIHLRNDFPNVTLRKYKSAKVEYTIQSAPRTKTLLETLGLIVAHWWLNRETVSVDNQDLKNLPLSIITLIQSMAVPSV